VLGAILNERDAPIVADALELRGGVTDPKKVHGNDGNRTAGYGGLK